MITDAIESLADLGYKFAHFAWSHAPEGDYGTWGEDTGNEFKVGNVVATTIEHGIGLLDDVLQDGNHHELAGKQPGVGAQIGTLPSLSYLLVGDKIAHHALMANIRQRGV